MQSTKALMLATLLTATASATNLNQLADMQLNENHQACLCETMDDGLEAAIDDYMDTDKPTDLEGGGLEAADDEGSECYRSRYPDYHKPDYPPKYKRPYPHKYPPSYDHYKPPCPYRKPYVPYQPKRYGQHGYDNYYSSPKGYDTYKPPYHAERYPAYHAPPPCKCYAPKPYAHPPPHAPDYGQKPPRH